jgi:hypothetical protein
MSGTSSRRLVNIWHTLPCTHFPEHSNPYPQQEMEAYTACRTANILTNKLTCIKQISHPILQSPYTTISGRSSPIFKFNSMWSEAQHFPKPHEPESCMYIVNKCNYNQFVTVPSFVKSGHDTVHNRRSLRIYLSPSPKQESWHSCISRDIISNKSEATKSATQ